jgi:integrase
MPKKAKELSALEAGRLKTPGLHFVGGVRGLALQVAPGGARTWVLRFSIAGKRRDMGLGGFPEITLAAAREKAREARAKADQGIDPILHRQAANSAHRASVAAAKTFAECVTGYVDAKSAEWKNPKHRQQWSNTLEQYANPVIGPMLVRDVTLTHVLNILEPIWTTKTETASRVRGRIESVLNWATARGYRSGENPARWRGHLDKLLPAPKKVAKVEHHAALDVNAVPGFMSALREQDGLGAKALEFLILTATRSGEVRGATWDEIDLDNAIWTIPAERMKAGREHRVPLSPAAIKLLKALPRVKDVVLLFPSTKNTPLSDMTLTGVLRRMGVEAVPHGFRSTFRDWAAERTSFPNHVVEMALAHTIGDKVEAAYRRGDLFAKRMQLMSAWAKFCASPASASGCVVPFEQAARRDRHAR